MHPRSLLPAPAVLLLGACAMSGGSPPDASRPPPAPPVATTAPGAVTTALGAATTAPSADSPTASQGFTPSCETPADCPGRSACVVSALGRMGCGAGVCCGTQECYNGCSTNADCPPCRPTCFKDGGRHGTCRLKPGM